MNRLNVFRVIGNIPIKAEAYETVIQTQKDKVYSQAAITAIEEFFTTVLGNEGYAFAEVQGTPEINEDTQEVDLVFAVNAGGYKNFKENLNFFNVSSVVRDSKILIPFFLRIFPKVSPLLILFSRNS